MDPSKYKTVKTTRGFTYNYYYASAKQPKPTILFCHGFPSTSSHWRREAVFFEAHGYGVVVPDMLGYGGTSKPTNTDDYLHSKISKDIVDILDSENLERVIAVGHDWGSASVSRLATHYPERFLAYAFFAVPYVLVRPPTPYEDLLAYSKAKYGYELYGYWEYLASEEFQADFLANPEAFINILFPGDPNTWVTHMAPRGLLRKAIKENFSEPAAKYVTEEEKKETLETFIKNGMAGPTRWYDILITNKAAQDNITTIPEERRFPPATSPIFFGAAKQDKVCVPQQGYEIFSSKPFQNHNVTIREFDGDHWIILSCADEINKELLRWIEDVVLVKANL